ncbi:MAG: aminotransferase class I/II-fold pyridoxal phosphate-dependent enzyme [Acidobacteriota bacterium]
MKLELFEMERMQSTWENRVRFNLSESGVHPLRLGELIDPAELLDVLLGYPQSNGTEELRDQVSDLYPGSDADNVLVTNGTAEANYLSVLSLIEPGDEAIVMLPNYMQIWGLARSLGAQVKPFPLREEERWAPDLDALRAAVGEKTRLIAVCNPNNPTGAILSEDEMRQICKAAGEVGAWLLADEVYQGAELDDETSPTFWGWYDRLLVTCGLSKAYGLPGLRIGWVVGPREKVAELWSYKDYTSIGPGALSERLARTALKPTHRRKILERTRGILRNQLPLVESWARERGELLEWIPPRAGAIAYLRYHVDVDSTTLVHRLREEKSVLVVPGAHFHMDPYVRIGYGAEPEVLRQGLALFSELLDEVHAKV